MKAAAAVQEARRGAADHKYVVGSFRLLSGVVTLAGVYCDQAHATPIPVQLTTDSRRFRRWRTKQAADQFIARHQIPNVHVMNLDFLDVVPMLALPDVREVDRSPAAPPISDDK